MRRVRKVGLIKLLGLAGVIVLVAAVGVAVAATINGDGTMVGTNGNDTFNLGNGNDSAFGLLGADTINGGNGNDNLDGDGTCMQGNQNGQYCQDGPQSGDQGDIINSGNGNDTIWGGGGHNTLNGGTGTDIFHGGPIGDTINTKPKSTDTIYLGAGGGNIVNINGGVLSAVVYANNGQPDTVNCFGSKTTTVYADHSDTLNNCNPKKVFYPARDAASHRAARHATRKHRHARRTATRR
jgi:Ca2+-binding RTX toxin-like protein